MKTIAMEQRDTPAPTSKSPSPPPVEPDTEKQVGLPAEKLSQTVGIENYNKPGEPVTTPPDDIRHPPETKPKEEPASDFKADDD